MKNKIQIYTDGAARGNPGPAGWGAVFLMEGKVIELGGRMDHATNNIMELMAPIEALAYLKNNKIEGSVEIVSDSKYVILGITEWISGWLRNNWRNAAKKPVANKELWEALYELNQEFKPKWSYVEGHMGHEHNERADVIATSFADNEPIDLKK
jgi:ribonuclease HI